MYIYGIATVIVLQHVSMLTGRWTEGCRCTSSREAWNVDAIDWRAEGLHQ